MHPKRHISNHDDPPLPELSELLMQQHSTVHASLDGCLSGCCALACGLDDAFQLCQVCLRPAQLCLRPICISPHSCHLQTGQQWFSVVQLL